jgi:hypothetical protein
VEHTEVLFALRADLSQALNRATTQFGHLMAQAANGDLSVVPAMNELGDIIAQTQHARRAASVAWLMRSRQEALAAVGSI